MEDIISYFILGLIYLSGKTYEVIEYSWENHPDLVCYFFALSIWALSNHQHFCATEEQTEEETEEEVEEETDEEDHPHAEENVAAMQRLIKEIGDNEKELKDAGYELNYSELREHPIYCWFIDEVFQQLMDDPVVLIPSGVTVDKSTAELLIEAAKNEGREALCPKHFKVITGYVQNESLRLMINGWKQRILTELQQQTRDQLVANKMEESEDKSVPEKSRGNHLRLFKDAPEKEVTLAASSIDVNPSLSYRMNHG